MAILVVLPPSWKPELDENEITTLSIIIPALFHSADREARILFCAMTLFVMLVFLSRPFIRMFLSWGPLRFEQLQRNFLREIQLAGVPVDAESPREKSFLMKAIIIGTLLLATMVWLHGVRELRRLRRVVAAG